MNKLEELDALVKAATSQPWFPIADDETHCVIDSDDDEWPAAQTVEHRNAALIVWLVNNAPAMLRAQAEEIARYEDALKTIRDRHIPDQPMADDSDEATYARKHHTELRNIARAALGSPPDA